MILSGELKPNLGLYQSPPNWDQILKYFKGTELYNYFKSFLDNDLTVTYKVQHVDAIPKTTNGTIEELFKKKTKMESKPKNISNYYNLLI